MVNQQRLAVEPRIVILLLVGVFIVIRHLAVPVPLQRYIAAPTPRQSTAVFWVSSPFSPGSFYEADTGADWDSIYKKAGLRPPLVNPPWPPVNFSSFKIDSSKAPQPAALPPEAAPLALRPIPINSASLEILTIIPGIGQKLAAEILRYRREKGPIRNLHDLEQIHGIGPRKGQIIAGYISW